MAEVRQEVGCVSRRTFLYEAGALATGALVPDVRSGLLMAGETGGTPAATMSAPWEPLVVQVGSEHVVLGRRVHRQILSELLETALGMVAGTKTAQEAWHTILSPNDVVGLKFNRCGSVGLGTTPAMARALVGSLTRAGFRPEQLVLIEVPEGLAAALGTRAPVGGWEPAETAFTSGRDRLAAVLGQVTAIINVPFVKTHNIAGITCCLKNLSHAMVKHPARFHENHCAPYIADIVALPQIRDKLRLNVANGLRVVFNRGPEAHDDSTWEAGLVLASRDPVALDAVAADLLNHVRGNLGLGPIGHDGGGIVSLIAAQQRNLGEAGLAKIELQKHQL